eukprot:TRINITY_DN32810_c0_g1_i1.p1 TRINITY_DN32810_c0_g1~~TRINITY_DN32810_c0_g1_i1.p1  ORF type:complete len:174 (+),score=50.54 TRINITY_DN32810_c0_g1_i1:38-559(+)
MPGEKKDKAGSPPPAKKQKQEKDAPQLNANLALDKANEGKPFSEIITLPPSALQGLGAKADEMLKGLKITTIQELGSWKFYQWAKAIVILAETEQAGKRPSDSSMNIRKAIDKAFEHKSFAEIAQAPPSALYGLADWADSHLKHAHINTVADLANWKFAKWAESFVTLAAVEQ